MTLINDLIDEFPQTFDVLYFDGDLVSENKDWIKNWLRVKVGTFLTV